MSRLKEIEDRCEKATPGPWAPDEYCPTIIRTVGSPYGHGQMHVVDVRGHGHLTGQGACRFSSDKADAIQDANAHFIAHARSDIPFLLSELRAALARAERAEALLREARDAIVATYPTIHAPDLLARIAELEKP